jgi:hypothetical protein
LNPVLSIEQQVVVSGGVGERERERERDLGEIEKGVFSEIGVAKVENELLGASHLLLLRYLATDATSTRDARRRRRLRGRHGRNVAEGRSTERKRRR